MLFSDNNAKQNFKCTVKFTETFAEIYWKKEQSKKDKLKIKL